MTSRPRQLASVLLALACASGCKSADEWAADADHEVYELVRSRREQIALRPEEFQLGRSPDNLRSRILRGEADLSEPLDLVQCLEIVAENSREYETRKEALYLAALDLTLERWRFTLQTGGTLAAAVEGTGDEAESAAADGRFSLTKLLGSGALIVADVGLNLARSLVSSDGWNPVSDIGVSITQPLLAGAGEEVVREPLTQAERDLVYAVRDFERYRHQLVLDVTTRYLRVVQAYDAQENQRVNAENFESLAARNKAMADAGRIDDIELGQARQNELRSRNGLVDAEARLERALDEFKLFLGLPVPVAIAIEPAALANLSGVARPEDEVSEELATELALARRLDFLNVVEREEDAARQAGVAESDLLAVLDVRGDARLQSDEGQPLDFDLSETEWSIGFEYVAPWERLPQRNSYRRALITLERSRRTREEQEDRIRADLREDLRQARAQLESLAIQRQAVEVADARIESTRLKLDAGRAETRDLIEAQESALTTRNSATAALIDYTLARMALYLDMELLRFEDGEIRLLPPEEAQP